MIKSTILIICAFVSYTSSVLHTQPEQIHLSYGADPTQMVVTWVTVSKTRTSTVQYGIDFKLDKSATGGTTKFIDGGSEKRSMYIHRVTLKNLIPGQKYAYHCGSDDGWSTLYTFTAMKSGENWSPRLAVYGDLGNVNGQSIPRLQQDAERGVIDAVLHVGDFAYDMDTDNARVGDEFMRQIEPIAANVPYMTTVGNHEGSYNFSNYVNRFTMVNAQNGEINNHFYSFNIGPAHIISFSTEFYYFLHYGWKQIMRQFEWLEKDLIEANKSENRSKRPWIITLGHRPMYCSMEDDGECRSYESILRKGIVINDVKNYGLEDLFHKYNVDLEIWAHDHFYERLWPMYDRKVYNGTGSNPYKNPKVPVQIITGSAGCNEKHDTFAKKIPEWSAFHSDDYGYSRMTIINRTHLHFEQVSDDQNGKIIDSFTLIKEHH